MNEGKIISKKRAEKFAVYRIWRIFASLLKKNGRLAQLVQSICLTSRGSAVRIRQRPQKEFCIRKTLFLSLFLSLYLIYYIITEECSSRRWQSHHFPRKSSHPCRTKPQTGRVQCLERASRFRCGTIHRLVCSAHLS